MQIGLHETKEMLIIKELTGKVRVLILVNSLNYLAPFKDAEVNNCLEIILLNQPAPITELFGNTRTATEWGNRATSSYQQAISGKGKKPHGVKWLLLVI